VSHKVSLLPEAKIDIKEIIEWYNEEKSGLGTKFYSSIKSSLSILKKNPYLYQIQYLDIRNALLRKFPYQIHYQIIEPKTSIIVLAVTHTSRNPTIWKMRK